MSKETADVVATEVKVVETVEIKLEDMTAKLSPETQRIADLVEKGLEGKIDINGTGALDKTLYVDSILTEDLPREVVERFTGHHRAVQAGLALGAGRAAFKFMQDNPDVKVVRVDLPTLGKDHYSTKITQQRDVAGTPSYGLVQVSHELHGSKDDDFMNVKSILANQARSIWEKL